MDASTMPANNASSSQVSSNNSSKPVLILLVIVLLVGIIGLVYVYTNNQNNNNNQEQNQNDQREDAEAAQDLMMDIQAEFQSLVTTGETLQSLSNISTVADAVDALEDAKRDVNNSIANIRNLPRVAGDEELRAQSIGLFEFVNDYLDEVIVVVTDTTKSEDELVASIEEKTEDFQDRATELLEDYQEVVSEFATRYAQ